MDMSSIITVVILFIGTFIGVEIYRKKRSSINEKKEEFNKKENKLKSKDAQKKEKVLSIEERIKKLELETEKLTPSEIEKYWNDSDDDSNT